MADPKFVETNPVIIEQQVLSAFQSALGRELYPAQIERLLADVATLLTTTALLSVNETGKQNLVRYATNTNLDALGELTDTGRLEGTRAQTIQRFNLEPAPTTETGVFLIPQGTQVSGSGSGIFETVDDALIDIGASYTEIKIQAIEMGEQFNGVAAGLLDTVVNLQPPSGSDLTTANLEPTQGGYVREPDDRYRERIALSLNRYGSGGSKDSYLFYTRSANPTIIDAEVLSPRPCFVEIYVLTDSGDASQVILDQVKEAVNDEKARPVSDIVTVQSAIALPVTIEVNVVISKNAQAATVLTDLRAELQEFATQLRRSMSSPLIRNQLLFLVQSVPGIYNSSISQPPQDVASPPGRFIRVDDIKINLLGVEGANSFG